MKKRAIPFVSTCAGIVLLTTLSGCTSEDINTAIKDNQQLVNIINGKDNNLNTETIANAGDNAITFYDDGSYSIAEEDGLKYYSLKSWPKNSELASMLPELTSGSIAYGTFSSQLFSLTVDSISEEETLSYIEKVKEGSTFLESPTDYNTKLLGVRIIGYEATDEENDHSLSVMYSKGVLSINVKTLPKEITETPAALSDEEPVLPETDMTEPDPNASVDIETSADATDINTEDSDITATITGIPEADEVLETAQAVFSNWYTEDGRLDLENCPFKDMTKEELIDMLDSIVNKKYEGFSQDAFTEEQFDWIITTLGSYGFNMYFASDGTYVIKHIDFNSSASNLSYWEIIELPAFGELFSVSEVQNKYTAVYIDVKIDEASAYIEGLKEAGFSTGISEKRSSLVNTYSFSALNKDENISVSVIYSYSLLTITFTRNEEAVVKTYKRPKFF